VCGNWPKLAKWYAGRLWPILDNHPSSKYKYMVLPLAKFIGIISLIVTGNAIGPSDLWLTYTASFGRQGADCAGRGICSFDEQAESGNVRLNYSPTDSVLTMQIINDKMEPHVFDKQIIPGQSTATQAVGALFEMEDDYVLSPTIKEQLRIQQGLQRIPKGKYKATGQAGITIVQFKIK
jgi:hypothetical protein